MLYSTLDDIGYRVIGRGINTTRYGSIRLTLYGLPK